MSNIVDVIIMDSIEQKQTDNQTEIDNPKNNEFTGTALTRIVSCLVLVFTVLMFYSFWNEVWAFVHYAAFTILTLLTLSIIANTLFPKKCWWGFRIVSFFIFSAYSYYLIDQFLLNPKKIDLFMRQSEPSPINALLGFLIIGIPALIYTFTGSRDGNYDAKNPQYNSDKAILLNKIRKYAYQSLLILTGIYIFAILAKILF